MSPVAVCHGMNPLLTRRGRHRARRPARAVVVIVVSELVLGLLPALDPIAQRVGGGITAARADQPPGGSTADATASAPPAGSAANSAQPHVAPRGQAISDATDHAFADLTAAPAITPGGWRDGTNLIPLSTRPGTDLDALKLYDLTTPSGWIAVAPLSQTCRPVDVAAARSRGDQLLCDGGQRAAVSVTDPGDSTYDGLAQGQVKLLTGSPATWQPVVSSMAFGFVGNQPALLFHGATIDAYSPLAATSARVVDAFRRQLRGQDAPPALQLAGSTAPDYEKAMYRLGPDSTVQSGQAPASSFCADPCFALSNLWGQPVYGTVSVSDVAAIAYDFNGSTNPANDVTLRPGIGYDTTTAPPAGGWPPMMVFRTIGTSLGVPLSSPLGEELYADLYAPSSASWSAGVGMTHPEIMAAMQAPPESVPVQRVSTAAYIYFTSVLAQPRDGFAVKDRYSANEVARHIPVFAQDPDTVIADGVTNYRLPAGNYPTVTINPSTDPGVVGVGQGVVELTGGQFRPVLIVQYSDHSLKTLALDTDDPGTVDLYGKAYAGRLTRSREVVAPPLWGNTSDVNTRSATTFFGAAAASTLVRATTWSAGGKFGTVDGRPVKNIGFGCYQQLSSDKNPIGPCVKVLAAQFGSGEIWFYRPSASDPLQTHYLQLSLVKRTADSDSLAGLWQLTYGVSPGSAADGLSQRGVGDTFATYEVAAQAGAIEGIRDKAARAAMAESILENGHKFPYTNGGRDVLTPTEAAELLDKSAVDATLRTAMQSPEVLADIARTTQDDAALAAADKSPDPGALVAVVNEPAVNQPTAAIVHRDGTDPTRLDQAMARRAAVWLLGEYRLRSTQSTFSGFGQTVAGVTSRLAEFYKDAPAADINQAVINAFVLLRIDNEDIARAFASGATDRAAAAAAMRYFLDPQSTGGSYPCNAPIVGASDAELAYRTGYDGLLRQLRSCGNASAYGLPATADVQNSAAARQTFWNRAQGEAARITVTLGPQPAAVVAQQVLALNAPGYLQWSSSDPSWGPLNQLMKDESTYLFSLLAKLDPDLANRVVNQVSMGSEQDMLSALTFASFSRDEIAGVARDAILLIVNLIRVFMRGNEFAAAMAGLLSLAITRANVDALAFQIADLIRTYDNDLKVGDPRTLDALLTEKPPTVPPGFQTAEFLNRYGALGSVAGLISLGLMVYRLKQAHTWRDYLAVADTFFSIFTAADQFVKFASLFTWPSQINDRLATITRNLGITEVPRTLGEVLGSEGASYQERVITAKLTVAAAKSFRAGDPLTTKEVKALLNEKFFTVGDGAVQRLTTLANGVGKAYVLERGLFQSVAETADDLSAALDLDNQSRASADFARALESGDEPTALRLKERFAQESGLDSGRSRYSSSMGPSIESVRPDDFPFDATAEDAKARYKADPSRPPRIIGRISTAADSWEVVIEAEDQRVSTGKDLTREIVGPVDDARQGSEVRNAITDLSDGVKRELAIGRGEDPAVARADGIVLRRTTLTIGLVILKAIAVIDIVFSLYTIALAAFDLFHSTTGTDKAINSLQLIAGVSFLVASVLELVGALFSIVVALPIVVFAILIFIAVLVWKLIVARFHKLHPERDDGALADWIQPYVDDGLTQRGAMSTSDLQTWHNNGWGMDASLRQCTPPPANTAALPTCLRAPNPAPHRGLYSLANVRSNDCVTITRGGSPAVPAMTDCGGSRARLTDEKSTGNPPAHLGWEMVRPYGRDEQVLWALPDPGSYAFAPQCLLPSPSSMACPQDYTRGDRGASAAGVWTVRWLGPPGPGTPFRLQDPATGLYLSENTSAHRPQLASDAGATDPGQQWLLMTGH